MADATLVGPRPSELDLVVRSARVDAPSLADVHTDALDWPAIVALARRHGVLALTARRLQADGWGGVPPAVVDDMTRYRATLAARNRFLTVRLLEVLAALGAAGISAIPYKGPILGAAAYGDLRLRPFKDLDILVSRTDALAAKRCLLAEGYVSLTPTSDKRRPGRLRSEYAFPLTHARDSLKVELHWRFAPAVPLSLEDVLPHARAVSLLGSAVTGLSPEYSLLVQCVHGAKHAWSRLEWVCALAHTVDRSREMDWDTVRRQAEAAGARRALDLGLVLASRLGGASVPVEVLRPAARRAGTVAAEVGAWTVRDQLGAPEEGVTLADVRLRLRSRSVGDRVRYCLYLVHPSEKDLAAVRLPGWLFSLYYVVRPVRIASEYAAGQATRVWHRRSEERAETARRRGRRVLTRQLAHQERKAAALNGREDEMLGAISEHWTTVVARLHAFGAVPDGARILEVGSGAHGLVFGFAGPGAVGVDPLAVDYARLFPLWQRRVPTVAGAGERLPFREHGFDVVVCDNVVDHAEGPAQIVLELARVLRPEGLLYFTVNVHHRLYVLAAWLHRTVNALGVPIAVGPFADHSVHLSPAAATRLFRGLPLQVLAREVGIEQAKERARSRPPRHAGDLLARAFYKNARLEVIARRKS